jgi:hypothetical protein
VGGRRRLDGLRPRSGPTRTGRVPRRRCGRPRGSLDGGPLGIRGVRPGFAWLGGGLALVSTVGAIALFFAGLRRVGPTAASILSTLEPVVTVALAFVVFGESLGTVQLAGGALVLMAVLAMRAPQPTLGKETL